MIIETAGVGRTGDGGAEDGEYRQMLGELSAVQTRALVAARAAAASTSARVSVVWFDL